LWIKTDFQQRIQNRCYSFKPQSLESKKVRATEKDLQVTLQVFFSAYVVHWTDYSSTRKSPIDREVRLAPSEKEAVKIAEAMIAENIKKGWSVGIVLETKRVEF
jgi:hypothetical protein